MPPASSSRARAVVRAGASGLKGLQDEAKHGGFLTGVSGWQAVIVQLWEQQLGWLAGHWGGRLVMLPSYSR